MWLIWVVGESDTFDGCNSLVCLESLSWATIEIIDFFGHEVHCVLKSIGFDNIKIELSKWEELALHLVGEGRNIYFVQTILDTTGKSVYSHVDPEGVKVQHAEINIEQLLQEREQCLQQYAQLLSGLEQIEALHPKK